MGDEVNEQANKKKAILEALEEYHGIVTDACRKAVVGRTAFYEWLKNDPEFKAAVDEIQDVALDFVEGKLFEKINGVQVRKGIDEETRQDIVYDLPPSDVAITFYLKTKGKKRGFVERQEFSNPDGTNLFGSKSDDELKEILKQVLEKVSQ